MINKYTQAPKGGFLQSFLIGRIWCRHGVSLSFGVDYAIIPLASDAVIYSCLYRPWRRALFRQMDRTALNTCRSVTASVKFTHAAINRDNFIDWYAYLKRPSNKNFMDFYKVD